MTAENITEGENATEMEHAESDVDDDSDPDYNPDVRLAVHCPVSDCAYIIGFCKVNKYTRWWLKSTSISVLFFCHSRVQDDYCLSLYI